MLHILEMIGKGIGITLLCVLILVLLLLLAMLFLPVRYVISGEKKPEEELPEAEAKISWLFHMISASAQFKGVLRYRLRLFGISVYDSAREPKKKKNPNKKKSIKKEKTAHREKDTSARKPFGKNVQAQKAVEEPRLVGKWEERREDEETLISEREAEREEELWQKIKEFCAFLKRLWRKIIDFPKNLANKIRRFRDRITYYREFLQREDLKRVIILCKELFRDLWKDIHPRVIRARIHAGFEDPSVTGQLLAFHGMLYPFIGRNVYIEPDWETPVIEGTLLIRGHITIFVLLRILWKLYFDKDIQSVRQAWKKEEV